MSAGTSLKYIKLCVASSYLDKHWRLQKAGTKRFVITLNKSFNYKSLQYTKKNQLLPLGCTKVLATSLGLMNVACCV